MKRGEDSPINNTLLRESTLKSIAYLESKVYVQEKEVYELIRAFFKEYLGLDYEFTHDELMVELQNVFYDKDVEDKVLAFLRKVSRVEYSDEEFSPESLKALLEEFAKMVEMLIKMKRKDKGFLHKLMFWKSQKDQEPPADKGEESEIADVIEDMEKNVAVDAKQGMFDDKERPIHNERIPNDEQQAEPDKTQDEPEQKEMPAQNEISYEPQKQPIPEDNLQNSPAQQPAQEDAQQVAHPEDHSRLEQLSAEINESGTEQNKASPEPQVSNDAKVEQSAPNMQQLLDEFNQNPSTDSYNKLNEFYESLSDEEKTKYYDQVMKAFSLVKSLSSSKENT